MKLVLGPVARARDRRRRHARRPAGAAAARDRRRRSDRLRARSGHRPPRSQAEQHPRRRVRRDRRHRLGPGEGSARGAADDQRRARSPRGAVARAAGTPRPAPSRHAVVHVARAGGRRAPSTRAPTSTRSARSSTRCSPARRRRRRRDHAGSTARPSARSLEARLPPDLLAIVDKALAADAARRYPSAFELGEDLRRFPGGQLVAARRYSPPTRAGRFVARHPLAALAALACSAALAAARAHRSRPDRDPRGVRRARRELRRARGSRLLPAGSNSRPRVRPPARGCRGNRARPVAVQKRSGMSHPSRRLSPTIPPHRAPHASRRHRSRPPDRRGAPARAPRRRHHRNVAEQHVHRPVGRRARALASVRGARRPPHPAPRGRHGRAHRRRRRRDQHRRARRGRAGAANPAVRPGARQGDRRRHDRAVPAAAPAGAAAAPPAPAFDPPPHRPPRSIAGSPSSSRSPCCCTSRSSSTCARSTGRGGPSLEEIPDRFVRQMVRAPRPRRRPRRRPTVAAHTPDTAPRPQRAGPPAARPRARAAEARHGLEPRSANMGLIPLLTARGPRRQLGDRRRAVAAAPWIARSTRRFATSAAWHRQQRALHGLPAPGSRHGKVGDAGATCAAARGIVDAAPTGPVAERDVSSRLKVDRPVIEGGRADLESITREIRARRKAIAACYERALKPKPTLAGKLVVRFSITAAGTDRGRRHRRRHAGRARGRRLRARDGAALAVRAARRGARRAELPVRVSGGRLAAPARSAAVRLLSNLLLPRSRRAAAIHLPIIIYHRAMAAVTVRDLVVRYDATTVLDRVSVSVASGELLMLLGPSGCGKTTLLRSIAGFIEPDGGVDPLRRRGGDAAAPAAPRNVGMVFQSFALWPHMTVAENVALRPARAPRPGSARSRTRVEEALESTRMGGYGKRPHRPAVGRRAAAGRAGARARDPAALPAARRAAVEPGREAAPVDARGDPPPVQVGRADDHLRHARSEGGAGRSPTGSP